VSDSSSTCSVIYVLDGQTEQIIDLIRLGPGEQVHDIGIDPSTGKIYATGEYNYQANDSEGNGEQIPANKSNLKEFMDVSVDKNITFDILIDSNRVLDRNKNKDSSNKF
jgi:hypothetical protein